MSREMPAMGKTESAPQEFTESFQAAPEQRAAHDTWAKEWMELTEKVGERIKLRAAEIVREREEDARTAAEISAQLNREIDAMIAEAETEAGYKKAA